MKKAGVKKAALLVTLGLGLGVAFAAVPANTYLEMSGADIPTLDPAQAYDTASGQAIENMYETLLTYKGKSLAEFEPLLATAWTQSNNGRTYTFTLRPNVKFHSGNTMTCEDAEYSFERLLVTNESSSGIWFTAESLLGTSANAKDDKTITWARIDKAVECDAQGRLVFTLPKADPAFISKLAYTSGSIIDKKHAVSIGEWSGTEKDWQEWVGKDLTDSALSKKPSGTGAYMLVSNTPTQAVFKAHPNYWGGKPKIENVILQVVPELATRIEALKRGDADTVEMGGRSSLSQVQGAPGVRIIDDIPNTSATMISLNQNIKNPAALGSGKLDGKGIPANFFSDVNVRKGFAHAFDYDRYIKEVQQGKGMKRSMLLPDSFLGYDPKVKIYDYNPELAASYFKKAFGGQVWQNGFVLEANYRANSVPSQTALEILKANVEKLNPKFKLNISPKPWSDLLADSRGGKTPMLLVGWAPDYADPDNFIHTFYHSEGYYSPRLNFKDAQIDQLIEQARTTTDVAKRKALYSLIGQRAYSLAPAIIVPAPVGYNVVRENLKGVDTTNVMYSGGYLWKNLSK